MLRSTLGRTARPTCAGWALSSRRRTDSHLHPARFRPRLLTLEDATEVFYQISTPYQPDAARGLRWSDPAIGIRWPAAPAVMSERDAAYPLLRV